MYRWVSHVGAALLCVAGAAAASQDASAQPEPLSIPPPPPVELPPMPKVLTGCHWAALPKDADMARYYPPRANQMSVEGEVKIICSVRRDGRLRGCRVYSEDPPDMGFGRAALKLSASFRMNPLACDGEPAVGKKVAIPIHFVVPG
ncbi:MAG TPA: energy transducer TonB [Caulobacteraceae bacterium]